MENYTKNQGIISLKSVTLTKKISITLLSYIEIVDLLCENAWLCDILAEHTEILFSTRLHSLVSVSIKLGLRLTESTVLSSSVTRSGIKYATRSPASMKETNFLVAHVCQTFPAKNFLMSSRLQSPAPSSGHFVQRPD